MAGSKPINASDFQHLWHQDHRELPQMIHSDVRPVYCMSQGVERIVKLSFKRSATAALSASYVSREAIGTGFFVNIPEAPYESSKEDHHTSTRTRPGPLEPPYEYILTAGHNLIGDDGQLSTDVKVLLWEEPIQGKTWDTMKWVNVHESQILICEDYRKTPGPRNSRNDWAIIRIPRKAGITHKHRGFGINLLFGVNDEVANGQSLIEHTLQRQEVTIQGFTDGRGATADASSERSRAGADESTNGDPVQITRGNGYLRRSTGEVEYNADTDKGLSGSPVWLFYQGKATAVAIHAYGKDLDTGRPRAKRRSRETRISLKLLEELYRWAGIGFFSKTLKVDQVKMRGEQEKYPQGLYLRFPGLGGRARVRLGPSGLDTTFDILPALSKPDSKIMKYAFRFHNRSTSEEAPNYGWVLWDTREGNATVVNRTHQACLVRLERKKARWDIFQVVSQVCAGSDNGVENDNDNIYELRMGIERLDPDDEDLGIPAETTEVSLNRVKYMRSPLKNYPFHYNYFCFEDAERHR